MRVWVVLLLLPACFYEAESPLPPDFGICAAPDDALAGIAQPTWYRDVEPLVVAKCVGCHTDTGIAPFALTTYQDFVPVRDSIHRVVADRIMPPWQPAACCNHYRWDRSLTDSERGTLLRWLEQGMVLGDVADAVPVSPPPPGLPRVDLHAQMAVPFTPMPKIGADELRCFILDHELTDRDRYITGFDFKPGVRGEVHHVTVSTVDEDELAKLHAYDGEDGRPGWDCWGKPIGFSDGAKFIGGWQPGELPRILPDGLGRLLPARTRIVLQIHYDTGHGSAPDLSSIDIMLEDHVDRLERGAPVGNPLWFLGEGMEIPANAPDTRVWFAYDPTVLSKGEPIEIHNVMLHMHELGTIGRVAILREDGTAECLLNIPSWDFHWMADYYFETPVVLRKGDRLYVECHWDNTAENQKVVNGVLQEPRTLHWGTDQEMCGAVLAYSVAVGLVKAAALLALAACGTGTTFRTTRLAPPGHTEWLFGAQAAGVSTTGMDEGGSTMDKAAPLPELAVGARHGLDERFELQVSGTLLPTPVGQTGSMELGGKARLFEHGRWSLAAGSGIGYRIAHMGGAVIEDVYVSAPVMGAVELGRNQLVLSVDGGYHRAYSSGAKPVGMPFVGQSLGFRWQVSRACAILPEVGSAWTPTSNAFTERSRLFHAGLAVLWTR